MIETTYVGASGHCSGGPTPGARALMAWYLAQYGPRGGTDLGIYGCRTIAGSTEMSLHSDGRAADLGCPTTGQDWSLLLAHALVDVSGDIGVQCVIHRRQIWSSAYPYDGFRPYRGSDPHTGHIHTELTPHAALTLNIQDIANTTLPKGPLTVPELIIGGFARPAMPGKQYARYADGSTTHLGPTEYKYWVGRGVPQIALTPGEGDAIDRLEAARCDK